jgi:hypothetical protein
MYERVYVCERVHVYERVYVCGRVYLCERDYIDVNSYYVINTTAIITAQSILALQCDQCGLIGRVCQVCIKKCISSNDSPTNDKGQKKTETKDEEHTSELTDQFQISLLAVRIRTPRLIRREMMFHEQ